MLESFSDILSFLLSPPQSETLFLLKIIFLFFGFIFSLGSLILLFKTSWLRLLFWQDLYEVLTFRHLASLGMKQKWKKILKMLKTDSEAQAKLAIIEATRIFQKTLKKLGYQKRKLEENLKDISDLVSNYEDLLLSYKNYLNIIEDPSFKISSDDAKKTILNYEKALKELGVL